MVEAREKLVQELKLEVQKLGWSKAIFRTWDRT